MDVFLEKNERKNASLPRRPYALYAFFLSLFGILLAFAAAGITPFGSGSLLSMDAWSQYFPMLLDGQGLFSQWSFSGALGFNSLAQSAYYTMSPLWWPLYLFGRPASYVVLHLLIALRFALAGLFFYLFLARRYRPSPLALAFSLAYSISAYPLAFLNQFMWMDAVMLLPLVALGIWRLIEEERPILYLLSLALTLYSCFYIGYMVCLFSVLYFFLVLFVKRRPLLTLLKRGGLFAAFSLLAGGLSAFVLIPTYLCLGNTLAMEMGFSGEVAITRPFAEILLQFLPFGKISLEFGPPNLYCGIPAVLLFLLGLFLPGRRIAERILLALTALLIYFSCTVNLFDFVWHGMHYPNQLPGRQSFIFVFLILAEAYRTLPSLGLLFRRRPRLGRRLASALSLLLALEVLLNGVFMVGTQTWVCDLASYSYWDGPMKTVEEKYSQGAWRSEKITCFNFNAPMLYGYNGISYYSSTMSADAYRFFGRLGMGVYAQNVSTMYKPSNILNMLFGVRYLHAYNGDTADTLFVDHVETVGTVTVYENRYTLPLAFAASRDALLLDLDRLSGEDAEGAMLRTLLGDELPRRYNREGVLSSAYEQLSAGGMTITAFSDSHIKGRVTVGKDQFLFTSIPADEGWSVWVDGERVAPQKVFGYLLGIPLSEGEHTVELSYTAPGFTLGLCLSLASLAATVLYLLLWEGGRARRRKALSAR